jgi:hypothetical protein
MTKNFEYFITFILYYKDVAKQDHCDTFVELCLQRFVMQLLQHPLLSSSSLFMCCSFTAKKFFCMNIEQSIPTFK